MLQQGHTHEASLPGWGQDVAGPRAQAAGDVVPVLTCVLCRVPRGGCSLGLEPGMFANLTAGWLGAAYAGFGDGSRAAHSFRPERGCA